MSSELKLELVPREKSLIAEGSASRSTGNQ